MSAIKNRDRFVSRTKEEDRTPVGRPDFKSGEMRTTCLVGSTPTLFRQFDIFVERLGDPFVDRIVDPLGDRLVDQIADRLAVRATSRRDALGTIGG